MQHVNRLRLGIAVIPAVLGFLFGETHGDIRRQLKKLDVPEDFELVAIDQSGSRCTIAAPPHPRSIFSSAFRRGGPDICERLRAIAAAAGDLRKVGGCAAAAEVRAGLSANLVGVWKYNLFIYTIDPLRSSPTALYGSARCDEVMAAHAERRGADELRGRHAPCYVPPGHHIVAARLLHRRL